jgi:hypothetical protein
VGHAIGVAHAVRSARQGLDIQFHQALGRELDHLPNEIRIGGLSRSVRRFIVGSVIVGPRFGDVS